jgi:chromosome segregation ATPase
VSDSDAATRPENEWPTPGIRQRLGSRIERHVLRSAVDLLDERGADLDKVEKQLVKREGDLVERILVADEEETQLARREERLADVGDADATRKIDHLIRQLDATESATAAFRTKAEAKVHEAEEKARELAERVRRLEDAEHKRVLSAADITRRESALRSREHEIREQDERLREREQAIAAKQHALIAQEQKLEQRERSLERVEQDARTRRESLERLEQELQEREQAPRAPDQRWWGSDPASSY